MSQFISALSPYPIAAAMAEGRKKSCGCRAVALVGNDRNIYFSKIELATSLELE